MKLPFDTKYNYAHSDPGKGNVENNMKKDQIWFLRKMQNMYALHLRNESFIPYGNFEDIEINRLYAQGRQPIGKYMDRLLMKDKGGNRKGWMNISWDNIGLMVKYRSLVKGKLTDMDFASAVQAIDGYSMERKEDKKWDILVKNKYADRLEPIKQSIGIEEEEESLPFTPKNMKEANDLAAEGFLRMEEEIEMDGFILATQQKCDWVQIKEMLIEDLIDLGYAAAKDFTDPVTNKPMTRYVDPKYLIIRQSRKGDFSDVTQAAEVTFYTIGQLKEFGLKKEELYAAATAYNGMFGNMTGAAWDRDSMWDEYKVAVLDGEFESFDATYQELRRDGQLVTLDGPNPTSKKNKVTKKEFQKLYRAKWIIGTDVIFDFGEQFDINYAQDGRPKSSFTVFRVAERSMVNQCISAIDDFQLAVLRLRNAIAKAPPAGVSVEWGSLSGMTIGGNALDPMEILKIRNDTGDLLWRAALSADGTIIQGATAPIQELGGGVGQALNELITVMDLNIKLIRDITGINELADASTPPGETLVGVAQIAQASTNNVLKPIIYAYKNIKKRVCNNLVTRWQLSNHFYGIDRETLQTDEGQVIELKMPKGIYHLEFEAYCNLYISDQEKAELNQACLQSMQAAKTGSVGITLSDYLYIKRLMARNNINAAWLYLANREQQMQALSQMTADRNQQLNNEAAAQQAQIKEQGELAKIQAKTQGDLMVIDRKAMYDIELKQMELRSQEKVAREKPVSAS